MADDNLLKSDEEKAEELKQLWNEYKYAIFTGITLSIGLIVGWNYYKQNQREQAEQGSMLFERMNKAGTIEAANEVIEKSDGTTYADFARLSAAKMSLDKGDASTAEKMLNHASDADSPQLALLAKIRLARILVDTDELDKAKGILNDIDDKAFDSLKYEVLGDIAAKEGDKASAKAHYEQAILNAGDSDAEILKMKRDNLSAQ